MLLLYQCSRKSDPRASQSGLLPLAHSHLLMPSLQEHGSEIHNALDGADTLHPIHCSATARAPSCLHQQKMEGRRISPISLAYGRALPVSKAQLAASAPLSPIPASQLQQGVLMASSTTQLLAGTQPSFLPSWIKDGNPPSRGWKSHSRQTLTAHSWLRSSNRAQSATEHTKPVERTLLKPPGRLCLTSSIYAWEPTTPKPLPGPQAT